MSYQALVFSHAITPRLKYVIDFLSEYYKLEFILTNSEEKYLSTPGKCKINYSAHRILEEEIWIHSHHLLFESVIHPIKIDCFIKNEYKAFFSVDGDFGFDLFASIFYLLTRYEEYLPHPTDEFGRFSHNYSLAFKEGFLHVPLINIWLEDFRMLLAKRNDQFSNSKNSYTFIPTYDIDIAWSYLHKGIKRNAGGLIVDLFKGRWKRIIERINVLMGKLKDPFDAYNHLHQLNEKYKLSPIYFFLLASKTSKYDKNINIKNIDFQQLIFSHGQKYETGIHPSWSSGDMPELLNTEKAMLQNISKKLIRDSRQHYIRFHFPHTYRNILTCGIEKEYSMGYGSINGFRASIAMDYWWFDLKKDEKSNLRIIPFCFMDSNSFYEEKLSPEQAFEELMHYYQITKSVNGTLVTVWHNNFLGTAEEFKGWKEIYERFLSEQKA